MVEPKWELGRYVRVVTRRDGTHNVSLKVPPHRRPHGWPESIRLPEFGNPIGCLKNYEFRKRVAVDAERLNRSLDQAAKAQAFGDQFEKKRLPELAEFYLNHPLFLQKNGLRSQARNRRNLGMILEWSESRGHPDYADIKPSHVAVMLQAFDDRQGQRVALRSVWSSLGRVGKLEWGIESPVKDFDWESPRPAAIHLWFADDVARYAAKAYEMGHDGLAALIQVQFFIGQRLEDAITCQHGIQYDGSEIGVRQGKTDEIISVPLPKHLRDVIENARLEGVSTLFPDTTAGNAFTVNRVGQRLIEVRHALLNIGDPIHTLNTLRHSACCEMARRGLTDIEIASRSGHRIDRVSQILERYILDRQGLARGAAVKQHIASGGSASDFRFDMASEVKDRHGDSSRLPFYRGPLAKRVRARPRRGNRVTQKRAGGRFVKRDGPDQPQQRTLTIEECRQWVEGA